MSRWLPKDETKWWFEAAERTFQPLVSTLGFRIVERHFHFQGNYLVYERDDAVFVIECGSDWNSLSGDLWIGPAGARRGGPIERVLGEVEPATEWAYASTSEPVDSEAMIAAMEAWERGITRHLPGLLATLG